MLESELAWRGRGATLDDPAAHPDVGPDSTRGHRRREHMTAREREQLAKVVRARERVAKTDAEHRGAALLAEFEEQIARRYNFDDDKIWRAAQDAAEEVVAAANARIADRCERLGIPEPFRPGIYMGWYPRGENAVAERRAELRRVARTRIDALVKEAKHEIARRSVEDTGAARRGRAHHRRGRAAYPRRDALARGADAPAQARRTWSTSRRSRLARAAESGRHDANRCARCDVSPRRVRCDSARGVWDIFSNSHSLSNKTTSG